MNCLKRGTQLHTVTHTHGKAGPGWVLDGSPNLEARGPIDHRSLLMSEFGGSFVLGLIWEAPLTLPNKIVLTILLLL